MIDYTRSVSEDTWENPIDVTALDPDDPKVAEEVKRRLASQNLTKVRGAARKKLVRQVRLTQMAERNSAQYCVVKVPGDSIFTPTPWDNPLRGESILSDLSDDYVWNIQESFHSSTPGGEEFPAEWGNLGLYTLKPLPKNRPPYPWEKPTLSKCMLAGWYLIVALPREVPHIVIDNISNCDKIINLDPSQCVEMGTDFDAFFTVYAPEGYEADARQLITAHVQQGLIDAIDDEDVELVDQAVIFFSPHTADWATVDSWEKVSDLRSLVETDMYSSIGEYTDNRVRQPKKKKGQQYALLPAIVGNPRIASPGKTLRNRE